MDIAEPLSMDDVILGLAMQDASPFNIKICKLDVNNYHHREMHSFKWLLGNVDEQVCWLRGTIIHRLHFFSYVTDGGVCVPGGRRFDLRILCSNTCDNRQTPAFGY